MAEKTVHTEIQCAEIANYEYIEKNILSDEQARVQKESIVNQYKSVLTNQACRCKDDGKRKCENKRCANRKKFVACPDSCGKNCQNSPWANDLWAIGKKTFVKHIGKEKGFGLFASYAILKGEWIGEYRGQVLDRVPQGVEKTYLLELGHVPQSISPFKKGSAARLLNHSCSPNCEALIYVHELQFKAVIRAIRDIKSGDELCFHYCWKFNTGEAIPDCKCSAKNCTGKLGTEKRKREKKKQCSTSSRGRKLSKPETYEEVVDDCFSESASSSSSSSIESCNLLLKKEHVNFWRLSNESTFLSKLAEQFETPSQVNQLETMSRFLAGETIALSAEDLLLFLQESPESLCGFYFVSIMLVDYVLKVDIVQLLQIFKSVFKQTNNNIQCVLRDLSRIRLDLNLRDVTVKDEYIRFLLEQQEKFWCADQVTQRLTLVSQTILTFLHEDVKADRIRICDENFTSLDRLQTYTLVLSYMMKEFYKKCPTHPSKLLLYIDHKCQLNTDLYLHVGTTAYSQPLFLHKESVNAFFTAGPSSECIVDANIDDSDTFAMLLYLDYDATVLHGKITVGVYKIAKILDATDMWWFLFRGVSYEKLVNKNNCTELLQILVLMNRQVELEHFASIFHLWFSGRELYGSLNGMEENLVTSLLSKTSIAINELEVYKILIQWSHNKAGIECTDEMKAVSTEPVKTNFQRVSCALHLMDLKPYYKNILHLGFITLEDISNLHKSKNAVKAKSLMSGQFSLDPRHPNPRDE